jgi:hypothetical protein
MVNAMIAQSYLSLMQMATSVTQKLAKTIKLSMKRLQNAKIAMNLLTQMTP